MTQKSKRFDDITIQLFEEQYRDALYHFKLSERQRIYSSLPKEVLDDALEDKNREANIVLNDQNEVIGFFVLHQHYQHEGYDTPKEVIYVRSLSINEAYQGHGYGTKMMMTLPEYVHTATKEEGPIGKERLYYLDLDSKYVSSLKLKQSASSEEGTIEVVDLVLDHQKVGFIAIEQFDQRLIIRALYVNDAYRDTGIAQSALRQLATYVRKQNQKIKVIEITLFGPNHQLKTLFEKSNFVETLSTEDYTTLEKYINY